MKRGKEYRALIWFSADVSEVTITQRNPFYCASWNLSACSLFNLSPPEMQVKSSPLTSWLRMLYFSCTKRQSALSAVTAIAKTKRKLQESQFNHTRSPRRREGRAKRRGVSEWANADADEKGSSSLPFSPVQLQDDSWGKYRENKEKWMISFLLLHHSFFFVISRLEVDLEKRTTSNLQFVYCWTYEYNLSCLKHGCNMFCVLRQTHSGVLCISGEMETDSH